MIKCCRSYNFTAEETAARLTKKQKDEENAKILRAKVISPTPIIIVKKQLMSSINSLNASIPLSFIMLASKNCDR